ncbi:ArsR/SmtB family transcription factor [Streptomyces sp. NPDC018036]|uniref:ArsR/SmtB family transcription factor n=1 Tax=Streptomyces sp. NPDC018036 TaxID=3365035 RepID=UPI0037B12AB8
MLDVTVIEDAEAAAVSLDPIRARLLAELAAGPASAAMLAGRVGLPRQKVNYHLKTLERHGLVELAGERRKGNVTERMMRATAASYVISPAALAAVQPDPDRFRDQLSARWLLALGARLVRDVGSLLTGAAKARKPLATYALDGEVTFASAADRAAFIEELTAGVSALIRKYHDGDAEAGRPHRIVVAVHPTLRPATDTRAGAGLDAGPDARTGVEIGAGVAAGPEARPETGPETRPETGPEAGEAPSGAPSTY